ncbi:6,7-dimethyl-8-ribityllumazine synthase, partial [Candidatus Hodgkinia cicadicola]
NDFMLARVVKSMPSFIKYDIRWFYGSYELDWMIKSSCYCSVIVLGLILKGNTEHYKLIADSSYQRLLNYPVVNYMLVCDEKEIAWDKVLNFDIASFRNSLYSIIGANMMLICSSNHSS